MITTPRPDHDVLVVGARCAGAATALLLARAGLSVLLVDRARPGTGTPSTHALTPSGVRQLARWGLVPAVRAAGAPRVTRVVQHYGDEAVEIPIRPRSGVDGLYAPRRSILDGLLAAAAEQAGAALRHRTALRELVVADGRVTGAVLDGPGGRTVVRSTLVVGADGARSTVARLAGAALRRGSPSAGSAVYGYVPGLPDDAYHNWFRPGFAAGLIPTDGGDAVVWVGGPPGWSRGATRSEAFARTLARVAPEVAASVTVPRRLAAVPGPPACTRQRWGPGWALVGDAAHVADPIGAHGMTDALVGAEDLVEAVLAVAGGAAEHRALARYARTRQRLEAAADPPIAHAASFAWDLPGLQRAHRALNAALRAEWEHLDAREGGRRAA